MRFASVPQGFINGIINVNFLLPYWSNPEVAANCPLQAALLNRSTMPSEIHGCPYPDMAQYFAEQPSPVEEQPKQDTVWPAKQ